MLPVRELDEISAGCFASPFFQRELLLRIGLPKKRLELGKQIQVSGSEIADFALGFEVSLLGFRLDLLQDLIGHEVGGVKDQPVAPVEFQ